MSNQATEITNRAGAAAPSPGNLPNGVFPSQLLESAIAEGRISAPDGFAPGQVQPASIDLRLGVRGYRVPASFLPGPSRTVAERLETLQMHAFSLEDGAVLERGCVYIIPLLESLDLPGDVWALANPKSSTGRIDVFARLITDGGEQFDKVRVGYAGPLYAEISPRTFSVRVATGARLLQLRLTKGVPRKIDRAAIGDAGGAKGKKQTWENFTVDLRGQAQGGLIGYRARKHAGLIDVAKVDFYDPLDFWEPVHARAGRGLILDPDDFHILASMEAVSVAPHEAAEMVAYDTLMGEFRVHYAGFFDPGFGYAAAGGEGSRAVLEVRSHEVPFLIEEGQIVGRLEYQPLIAPPDRIYGADIGSTYQRQGLMLSKHFKRPE